jgi:putative glutamine amidotransferase
MSAPIVALTATTKIIDGMVRLRLNEAYVQAIRAAGLTPLVLPPLPPEELEPVLAAVRGFVLTGGEDVDPAEYGAASLGSTPPHTERDKCELALVRLARDRNIPTLAICRGIQVVNVALGGTLVQDIPTELPSKINHDQAENGRRAMRVHDVFIEPGSKLAGAVGATKVEVNSSHHQALWRVAEGLRVTGTALDGVIEGAEWQGDYWWMLGVQWHPEELISDAADWDRGLFRAFARQVMALDQPVIAHD